MKNSEPVPKLRPRKSSQENGAGLSSRGRVTSGGLRGQAGEQRTEMRTSSSISNLSSRPRSTSLTRSQSQRLGGGRGRGQGPGLTRSTTLARPRSSTVASSSHRGQDSHYSILWSLHSPFYWPELLFYSKL